MINIVVLIYLVLRICCLTGDSHCPAAAAITFTVFLESYPFLLKKNIMNIKNIYPLEICRKIIDFTVMQSLTLPLT